MTRSPLRDLLVGLFVVVGLCAIAYLSFSVGGLSYSGPGGLTIYAAFDQTGGLKPRAPVVISGVKVGQVTSIALDPSFRARVAMITENRRQRPFEHALNGRPIRLNLPAVEVRSVVFENHADTHGPDAFSA